MIVRTVNYSSTVAPSHLTESLVSSGFAVIENHPISHKLISQAYDDWKSFFESEDKFKYRFKESDQAGYFPLTVSETAKGYSAKDIKEFYSYYDWAPHPQRIGPSTHQLYKELLELGKTFLGWIEGETPHRVRTSLSEPLSQMIENSRQNMMRIIHYPPLTGEEAPQAVRAAPHEDINLITLLPASTAAGLQVKDVAGNWIDIECDPGSIIVNTGDMLDLVTDGFYKATTHQVLNPSGDMAKLSRYSMPFFLHPRSEVQLSPSKTAGDYLTERLRELGLKT